MLKNMRYSLLSRFIIKNKLYSMLCTNFYPSIFPISRRFVCTFPPGETQNIQEKHLLKNHIKTVTELTPNPSIAESDMAINLSRALPPMSLFNERNISVLRNTNKRSRGKFSINVFTSFTVVPLNCLRIRRRSVLDILSPSFVVEVLGRNVNRSERKS